MKAKYDPGIIYSGDGRSLYERWLKFHRNPCSAEFADFMGFYKWALSSGYESGYTLSRFDNTKPYSAENCYWVQSRRCYTKEEKEWIDKWNDMVNRIRSHFGMNPIGLEEEDEDGKV